MLLLNGTELLNNGICLTPDDNNGNRTSNLVWKKKKSKLFLFFLLILLINFVSLLILYGDKSSHMFLSTEIGKYNLNHFSCDSTNPHTSISVNCTSIYWVLTLMRRGKHVYQEINHSAIPGICQLFAILWLIYVQGNILHSMYFSPFQNTEPSINI